MHFYPRSPCGERLPYPPTQYSQCVYFYPRSPCGERPMSVHTRLVSMSFLSTLSLRRATLGGKSGKQVMQFLSTLSLRRATPWKRPPKTGICISIHALLAESDLTSVVSSAGTTGFLSTLSLRRATYDTYAKVLRVNISIHALLAESDRGRGIW